MTKKTIISGIIACLIPLHQAFSLDAWLRVNQLGYQKDAAKKAIIVSESPLAVTEFSIFDVLTNEEQATFSSVTDTGPFERFNNTYSLDFTDFKQEGAYYIKIKDVYSPTIFINNNIYRESSGKLLDFMQSQRIPSPTGGWWYDAGQKVKNPAVTATTVYQLLFAYKQNPGIFADIKDGKGEGTPDGIPDILNEAYCGIQNMLDGNQPVYLPDSLKAAGRGMTVRFKLASLAGKYAAAFALGADILNNYYPALSETLRTRATETYQTGKKFPGVYLNTEEGTGSIQQEENWQDDMQLAAIQLYFMTFDYNYLQEAIQYGAAEPVPQWLFTNTDQPLQWYPYLNYSLPLISQTENPEIKETFLQNIRIILLRAQMIAGKNPFGTGVPMSENSNNKILALHNLCYLYRSMTGDKTFVTMENALFDWIFGSNPWGIVMATGLAEFGNDPKEPYSAIYVRENIRPTGGVLNGAISNSYLKNTGYDDQSRYSGRFQTDWAVYRDDVNERLTNMSTIDGTASMIYALAARQSGNNEATFHDRNIYDAKGLTRLDPEKKQITLVFTGNQYNDGYRKIRRALEKQNIKAAFFFSGDFLRKRGNAGKIKKLKSDGHYIGAGGDHFTQLVDWSQRDLLRVRKTAFLQDMRDNYAALDKFGIRKQDAPFFFPPYELYNDSISRWCRETGIILVRSTPGTFANQDFTFPEMRENYYSSKEIYNNIMTVESEQGLNGYILQFNFGTNPGRKDKFYNNLNTLLGELKKAGYEFTDLFTATGLIGKPDPEKKGKKK